MKAAFVDRDGTIIRDYPDAQWSSVQTPEFLPGSLDALKQFRLKGFAIIIITNQYIIGEGIIDEQRYQTINQKMLEVLEREGITILDILYCPHARNTHCDCLKPNPGMIDQALKKYPAINLINSVVVGDSACDAQLAAHFDMPFYGIGIKSTHPKAHTVTSLLAASTRQT